MPKLITVKRHETKVDRAKSYIRTFVLVPSVLLGMISLIVGYGGVVAAFFQDQLTLWILFESSLLLIFGAFLGWGHVRYQHHVLVTYPGHYAGRFQLFNRGGRSRRRKRETHAATSSAPQASLTYLLYGFGGSALLASMIIPLALGHLNWFAAIFLPLAGYFNGKFILWRRKLLAM